MAGKTNGIAIATENWLHNHPGERATILVPNESARTEFLARLPAEYHDRIDWVLGAEPGVGLGGANAAQRESVVRTVQHVQRRDLIKKVMRQRGSKS